MTNNQFNKNKQTEIKARAGLAPGVDARKSFLFATAIGMIGLFYSEIALAVDVMASGKALTDPMVQFFNAFYPIGIVAMGAGGAVLAQGDNKVRAIGFGSGCLLGGLMVSAVKAAYGI